MEVRELMTSDVQTCQAFDSAHRAAQIMWENDCGCVPVVGADGRVVGMITDRDICMAAYTQARPLTEIAVASAVSRSLVTVRENDSLRRAEQLMHDNQVRRLPVVDAGGRLVGLLSIGDLARRAREVGTSELVSALAGISQRREVQGNAPTDQSEGLGNNTRGATGDLRQEVKKGLTLLRTLRDEVRLKLHLGNLDFKDQWNRLEVQLGEVEKKAEALVETRLDEVEKKTEALTDASRAAVVHAIKKVEGFLSSLSGQS